MIVGTVSNIVARRDAPITLAEQIVAWLLYRAGEPVSYIAHHLQRPVPQVRGFIWRDAEERIAR